MEFLDNFSYLLFNFNDYPNGMVTLYNLLVMGNWQVWMQVSLIYCRCYIELELYLRCLLRTHKSLDLNYEGMDGTRNSFKRRQF